MRVANDLVPLPNMLENLGGCNLKKKKTSRAYTIDVIILM